MFETGGTTKTCPYDLMIYRFATTENNLSMHLKKYLKTLSQTKFPSQNQIIV